MWKTIKTTAFLLIVCLLPGIKAYAQINLSFENKPVKTVLQSIKRQTQYSFLFQSTFFDETDRVTIKVSNATIFEALDNLKKQLPIDYLIAGNMITLIRNNAKPAPPVVPTPSVTYLRGIVSNEQDEPLYGATVYVKRLPFSVATNIDGKFSLPNVKSGDTIVITNIGYEKKELVSAGNNKLEVKLVAKMNDLSDVSVTTGIHKEQKRRSTGAFTVVDGRLYNQNSSSNILDRLEGITPSLLFNRNIMPGTNQSEISIRGRSTIFSNADPLIVLDNFPYTGTLNSINPNDVEKITILKDATATALWGTFSGNGVIVITTKKGKFNQPLKVSFVSNFTVGMKPDIYYPPFMSSASSVEFEEFVFGKNGYRNQELNSSKPVLSPVMEILIKKRDGLISEEEARAQLDALKEIDVRKEMDKHFFRPSFFQQYGINVRGGGVNNHYYFSAGYDEQAQTAVNSKFRRLTVNGNHTFQLLNKKLEISSGMMFTTSRTDKNTTLLTGLRYPYSRLHGEDGSSLAVPVVIRQAYKDTAGKGILLDWNFRPLDEIKMNDDKVDNTAYRIDLGVKYKIMKGLQATVLYQYNRATIEENNHRSLATYFTRNLINLFTQIGSRGEVIRPIPLGGILDWSNNTTNSHSLRIQGDYNRAFGEHELSLVGGSEIRTAKGQTVLNRFYGYNDENKSSQQVNYNVDYPMFHFPFQKAKIPLPYLNPNMATIANFFSVYGNALYSFKRTYNASFSIRKDESNLFGVKANQKGVPLWAVGFSWMLSNEKFYKIEWLPELKLRVTNGYSGNVDKTVSAFTTARMDGQNVYGSTTASIINPPNPSLKWERSRMLNLGVDFSFKDNTITGSFDYFRRKAIDLLGLMPIDPTTGVEIFKMNGSSMKGTGFDIVINTKILKGKFSWMSTVMASYSLDKVDAYKDRKAVIGYYLNSEVMNPLPNKPLYSVFALKWMGLDGSNGDPIGLLDGHSSKEYSKIINSTNFDDLIFKGSAVPVHFGSFINTFRYKDFELTFILTYKLKYFFRRSSIQYFDLIQQRNSGHPDYALRWKEKGDELRTSVPSFQYPADFNRDDFYETSEVLVEKGDHVRFKDIRFSYMVNMKTLNQAKIEVFAYINNIGLIWKANKHGIDPDYINTFPAARIYSVGMKLDF